MGRKKNFTLEPGVGTELEVDRGDIDDAGNREWFVSAWNPNSGVHCHYLTTRTGVVVTSSLDGDTLHLIIDGRSVASAQPGRSGEIAMLRPLA